MWKLADICRAKRAACAALLCASVTAPASAPLPWLHTLTLAWDPSPDPTVTGYTLYYGESSHRYAHRIPSGTTNSVTLSNLVFGATYYFAVTTSDASAAESAYSPELAFVAPPPRLTLIANGSGTVSPNLNGRGLKPGARYALTARPGRGEVFAGWSGSITSSAARLSLLMDDDYSLQANFIPSPFLPVQGVYAGLFCETGQIRQLGSGASQIAATAGGAYSGKLFLGAARLSISGQLDLQCQATNNLARPGASPLTIQFRLGSGEQADQIFGQICDTNSGWTAELFGEHSRFNVRTNPCPWNGDYSLLLPGQDGDPTLPAGNGFGAISIGLDGRVRLTGTMDDGASLSQSALLSPHGFLPLYAPLYHGNGLLLSWLAFTNRAPTGNVYWFKPADAREHYYPGGFTNFLQAGGSPYLRPASASGRILGLTNASLAFIGGDLAANFTNSIVLGASGRVTSTNSGHLRLSLSLSTGTFSGNVTDPGTGEYRSFSGAVFQNINAGSGLLLGTNQTSRVLLAQ